MEMTSPYSNVSKRLNCTVEMTGLHGKKHHFYTFLVNIRYGRSQYVLDTVFGTWHIAIHLILTTGCEVDSIICSTFISDETEAQRYELLTTEHTELEHEPR